MSILPAATDAPPPLGPLLFECARLLDELAQAQVNREAGTRVARPAVMRLLPHLDRHGIRPSELAQRVDVSKQAVGQTLRTFEQMGLVEYTGDPSDGRAQLVRLTPAGEAAFVHGQSVLSFLESELAVRMGAQAIGDVTRGLAAMLPLLTEWTAAGAPIREAPVRDATVRGATVRGALRASR